jgi:ABC-2 type transport system permease protein
VHKIRQRYRYSLILLRELIRTDFKIRYQNSILGYVWSLLRPLLLFLILYFVFTKFLKVGTGVPHYPVYLLLGLLFWNFFVEVTMGSVTAIVSKGDLIRKINFPKYVIILAVLSGALINLSLTSVVIIIFMIAGHVSVSWQALLLIPLLLELILIAITAAFYLSTAFVKYRDVSYVWEVIIQAAFYATPILYPLTRIPHAYAKSFCPSNSRLKVCTYYSFYADNFNCIWWRSLDLGYSYRYYSYAGNYYQYLFPTTI